MEACDNSLLDQANASWCKVKLNSFTGPLPRRRFRREKYSLKLLEAELQHNAKEQLLLQES